MKLIRTERLILRNWEERDRAFFHRINSDEQVMAFFPFRRNRAEADALMDRLRASITESGYGFAAAEIAATSETAGFVGLKPVEMVPVLAPGAVEIGWRLAPEFWGAGYVTEAARAWLAFGFGELGLDEIVAYAVATNERSIAVMRRLGMRRDEACDFDFAIVPDSMPHLKRHVLYRLSRDDWADREKAAR